MVRTRKAKAGYARLDPFTRGQVVGFRTAGVPMVDIPARVTKKDGAHPSLRAVEAVVAKAAAGPAWPPSWPRGNLPRGRIAPPPPTACQ